MIYNMSSSKQNQLICAQTGGELLTQLGAMEQKQLHPRSSFYHFAVASLKKVIYKSTMALYAKGPRFKSHIMFTYGE